MVLTAGRSRTPKEDRDEWRSPPEAVRYMERTLKRKFNFDAACTLSNFVAPPLWEEPGFREGDSLSNHWPSGKLIWCNPPYSDPEEFIERAYACDSIVVFLINSPNGEARYRRLGREAHEIRIHGRLSFIGTSGKPIGGYTRGSSFFVLNSYGAGLVSTVSREDIMRLGVR